ncbi:MAG: hypothetical protein ACFFCS_27565 [Candidatus Hodarchaeota archaeon]
MIERLYCPDFSAIFEPEFANPFIYPLIDTLQWPVFTDVDLLPETKSLLAILDERGHPLLYHRKINSLQWNVERTCAGVGYVLFQAFYPDEKNNISNSQVISTCKSVGLNAKNVGRVASVVLCPEFKGSDVDLFEKNEKILAGVVIYPLFQKIDFSGAKLHEILQYCDQEGLPVKWDFHEFSTPKRTDYHVILPEVLNLFNKYKNIKFICSGFEYSGILHVTEKMKYYPRLWLELDPRVIGGTPPSRFLKEVFVIPGLIQNCWDRIIIGSATPTLEASQVSRGILEATEDLPFHLKCLLRTWLQRNAIRAFKLPLKNMWLDKSFLDTLRVEWTEKERHYTEFKDENGMSQMVIDFEIYLQSFSITQLIWIQPVLKNLWNEVSKKNDFTIETGELLLRSFHTTTSILVNEHERGNFLQLHYDLARKSMEDASDKLHTVAAEENRADFNYPDHVLASSVGNRNIIIPIRENSLQIGGRENFYVLVTFGPRGMKILARFKLLLSKN